MIGVFFFLYLKLQVGPTYDLSTYKQAGVREEIL